MLVMSWSQASSATLLRSSMSCLDGLELDDDQTRFVGLLALVAGEEVGPGNEPGTLGVARRVAKDRAICTVDPETRHMHKCRSSYRDEKPTPRKVPVLIAAPKTSTSSVSSNSNSEQPGSAAASTGTSTEATLASVADHSSRVLPDNGVVAQSAGYRTPGKGLTWTGARHSERSSSRPVYSRMPACG